MWNTLTPLMNPPVYDVHLLPHLCSLIKLLKHVEISRENLENSLSTKNFHRYIFHSFIHYSFWEMLRNYKMTQHTCHKLEKFLLCGMLKDSATVEIYMYRAEIQALGVWKGGRIWGLLLSLRWLWIRPACLFGCAVVIPSPTLISTETSLFGCPCNASAFTLRS